MTALLTLNANSAYSPSHAAKYGIRDCSTETKNGPGRRQSCWKCPRRYVDHSPRIIYGSLSIRIHRTGTILELAEQAGYVAANKHMFQYNKGCVNSPEGSVGITSQTCNGFRSIVWRTKERGSAFHQTLPERRRHAYVALPFGLLFLVERMCLNDAQEHTRRNACAHPHGAF
jgi:hypothetical protein